MRGFYLLEPGRGATNLVEAGVSNRNLTSPLFWGLTCLGGVRVTNVTSPADAGLIRLGGGQYYKSDAPMDIGANAHCGRVSINYNSVVDCR